MNVICVILAGGASRRMGRDKANLPLKTGETFLSRLVSEYSGAFPVYVSVGETGKFPLHGARELLDLHPGMGPLAGLEAAFKRTDAEIVFLTATDLPFGTLTLAKKLVSLLGDADACVIRRKDGEMEPAYGVYRKNCQKAVEDCLAEGRRAVRSMLSRVNVRWAEEAELAEFPLERLLQNVNTPEEYEKVQVERHEHTQN